MSPSGKSTEELIDDLVRMKADCERWAPVAFDALKVGMILTKGDE